MEDQQEQQVSAGQGPTQPPQMAEGTQKDCDEQNSLIQSETKNNNNYQTIKSDSSFYSTRHMTEDEKAQRTTSYYYSLATLFKGYLGLSFLALPSGFLEIGIIGVFLDLPLVLVVNLYSVHLLIKTRNKYKHENVQNLSDLTNLVYGGVSSKFSDVFVILLQGALAIVYTMYIGDELDAIFCDIIGVFECGHTIIYRYIFTMCMLPIIFKKQFRYFAKFSVVASIITILCIFFIIGIEADSLRTNKSVASDLQWFNVLQFPMYFGQTMCIYEGNGMLLNFYAQVQQPKVFMSQIYIVLTTITVSSLLIGIMSYLTYGNSIQDMITYNMPNNFCGVSVRVFYMIAIMGVYVLSLIPVFMIIEKYEWYQNVRLLDRPKSMITRALVVLIAATLSLMMPDITSSLSLGGSVAGVIISIIVPALLYNKAFMHSEKKRRIRKFNYVFMILGMIFGLFGAVETLFEIVLKMVGIIN